MAYHARERGHPVSASVLGSKLNQFDRFDGGCVKTSARFRTSLFRSLLRGLRAFRVEKIAKNLALLDRLQNFVEFLHGLDVKRSFRITPVNLAVGGKLPVAVARRPREG